MGSTERLPLKENLPPLWIDRFRPKQFKQCNVHPDLADLFYGLVNSPSACDDLPHLLVFGPSGSGKKTLIHCLLRAIYGSGVDNVKIDEKDYETASKKKFTLTSISSNYHIEVTPAAAGWSRDKIVIQDLVKASAQVKQLDVQKQRQFKVFVIREAERLSQEAQNALRRTMEKYIPTCRLILCCNSSSRLSPAIKSRCLLIRVPAAGREVVAGCLVEAGKVVGVQFPEELAMKVSEKANGNLRLAYMMAQTLVQQAESSNSGFVLTVESNVPVADWRLCIDKLANHITGKPGTPETLKDTRPYVYQLLAHCIPAYLIFYYLSDSLIKKLDSVLTSEVLNLAAMFEHRCGLGKKTIYHIEGFIAAVMFVLKNHSEAMASALDDDDFGDI